MAVGLSPWPTETSEIDAAVDCLRQVLPDSLDDARIKRLGAVAAAHVERYAGNAPPQNVRDQAVEMLAGYVAEIRYSSLTGLNAGSVDLKFSDRPINYAAAFRNSGAAGMLSPWKKRRAGAIG